jgi:hypothetical protein
MSASIKPCINSIFIYFKACIEISECLLVTDIDFHVLKYKKNKHNL